MEARGTLRSSHLVFHGPLPRIRSPSTASSPPRDHRRATYRPPYPNPGHRHASGCIPSNSASQLPPRLSRAVTSFPGVSWLPPSSRLTALVGCVSASAAAAAVGSLSMSASESVSVATAVPAAYISNVHPLVAGDLPAATQHSATSARLTKPAASSPWFVAKPLGPVPGPSNNPLGRTMV